MVKKNRSNFRPFLLILFFAFMCGSLIGLIWIYQSVTSEIVSKYGEPSPKLNQINRLKYSYDLYRNGNDLLKGSFISEEGYVFEILQGESIGQIAFRLMDDRIIENAEIFRVYLIYRGYDRFVQAGVFQVDSGMNAIEIAEKIINPTPELVPFTVLPGWRAEEIAASLPRSGLNIDPQAFLDLVKNPGGEWFLGNFVNSETLEGYLAPGEYVIHREIELPDFVRLLTNRFEQNISQEILERISENGMSLNEVVILASIIERESIISSEMPKIASVFLNRYSINMKLDSDPTVQYALGFNQQQSTWWTNPLTLVDLQIDSPYNTYMYAGLPPGSISNPSLSAINAVVYPEQTNYYYFRAKCDGSGLHEFAESFEEHLQNGCQ